MIDHVEGSSQQMMDLPNANEADDKKIKADDDAAYFPSVFWSETHGCREALIWRGTRANSELYSEDIIYGDFVPESLLCICEVYTRVLTLKVSIDPRVGKACFVRYPACSMWLLLLGSCGPATLANTQSLYTRVHVSYGPLNFGYVLTTLVHLK